jgi:hypothetical protein
MIPSVMCAVAVREMAAAMASLGRACRWRQATFEQRRAHAKMMADASVRASTCPWCASFNKQPAARRAHALICKQRGDADPGIYK